MRATMSSLKPLGSGSASMSLVKPHLYSLLASCSMVWVAVLISMVLSLDHIQRHQLRLFFDRGGRRQAFAQQIGQAALVADQIGEGDLIEAVAQPVFQRLPERLERAGRVIRAYAARRLGPGMFLAIFNFFKKRLAERQKERAQPDLLRRLRQT